MILQLDSFSLATALIGVAGARVVYEHSPHHVSRKADEMFTAVPIDILVNKAQIRLIDQGSRLQGVVRPLAPHVGIGNAMELCVHERQESFSRCLIAGMNGLKKPRSLASIFIHGNFQEPRLYQPRPF